MFRSVWLDVVRFFTLCNLFMTWNLAVKSITNTVNNDTFDIFALLEIINKYGVLISQWTWLYQALVFVFFLFFFCFFLKSLLNICPFFGPLILLFRTSGDISSGFQSQSGQPYSNFSETYVIYVPQALLYLSVNQIALWIIAFADNWTAERKGDATCESCVSKGEIIGISMGR